MTTPAELSIFAGIQCTLFIVAIGLAVVLPFLIHRHPHKGGGDTYKFHH